MDNNALSLPSGMMDYGQAAASWNQYAVDNNLTAEQTQTGLNKLATGDLPEGANIAKAIVDGYLNGVLIAGAWYLGPAASIGKVVAGSTIGEIANGSYQWYDLSKTGNENKSWDYWGSTSAAITGGLAPGRDIWANTAIAMGSTVFTDGLNGRAISGSGFGTMLGGGFGEIAPIILKPVFGNSSGFVGEVGGAFVTEIISNGVKNTNHDNQKKDEKK